MQGATCKRRRSCGTALTLDALSAEGTHLGGLIVPGLRLMHEAITQRHGTFDGRASGSRIVEMADNTADAIESGIQLAAVAVIERFVARARARLGTEPAAHFEWRRCGAGERVAVDPAPDRNGHRLARARDIRRMRHAQRPLEGLVPRLRGKENGMWPAGFRNGIDSSGISATVDGLLECPQPKQPPSFCRERIPHARTHVVPAPAGAEYRRCVLAIFRPACARARVRRDRSGRGQAGAAFRERELRAIQRCGTGHCARVQCGFEE